MKGTRGREGTGDLPETLSVQITHVCSPALRGQESLRQFALRRNRRSFDSALLHPNEQRGLAGDPGFRAPLRMTSVIYSVAAYVRKSAGIC